MSYAIEMANVTPGIPVIALTEERVESLEYAGFEIAFDDKENPKFGLLFSNDSVRLDEDYDDDEDEPMPWTKVLQEICQETGIAEFFLKKVTCCSAWDFGCVVVRVDATRIQSVYSNEMISVLRENPSIGLIEYGQTPHASSESTGNASIENLNSTESSNINTVKKATQ